MDVLTYDYGTENANKLYKVTDGGNDNHGFKDGNKIGNDYVYDDNGNMVMDKNKGIGTDSVDGITYNHLNLPTQVTIANNEHNGTITYIYDATGVKQKKVVSTGNNTLYAGNYIYEGTSGNETLQFFNHAEGYFNVTNSPSSGELEGDYVYQYKDHLGNIRLSYSDANGDGNIDVTTNPLTTEIVSEKNYYPFGLQHKGYNYSTSPLGNGVAKKFGFGGKEYGEELGLDWYDVSARNYDPALGRWMNLDPLAEQMRRHSPYNFGFDNPIYFQDYDGMAPQGCCGNPIPTYTLRITIALIDAGRKFLNMKPFDIEGDRKRTSTEDRIDFRSKTGGGEGDTTDAPTLHIDGDVIVDAAKSKSVKTKSPFKLKGTKGKGTMKNVGNAAKDFGKGVKDAKKKMNQTEVGGQVISTLGSGNGNEPDSKVTQSTTRVTYTIYLDTKTIDSTKTTINFTGSIGEVKRKIDSTAQNAKRQRKSALNWFN